MPLPIAVGAKVFFEQVDMAAALKKRPLKRVKDLPYKSQEQKPGFFFSEQEMRELLTATYFGQNEQFASRLERLDNNAHMQKDRAQPIDPMDRKFGNSLLNRFTHKQVLRAMRDTNVKFQGICKDNGVDLPEDWPEYCLKVWIGKINPAAKRYANRRAVTRDDKTKAMVLLSQQLANQEKEIDLGVGYKLRGVQKLFQALRSGKSK